MSISRELAARIEATIEHELVDVMRLCDTETWVGPQVQSRIDELKVVRLLLRDCADDLRSHDVSAGG